MKQKFAIVGPEFVATTYNAAAESLDEPPLSFWDRHGRRAVNLLGLKSGSQVLDAGCGSGASALPAARIVGRAGWVFGVDVAEKALELARSRANACGLENVAFECLDMTASGLGDERFDAIISVFSLFFVPDMKSALGELWRLVRPGGELLVSTWGPHAFQPCAEIFTTELSRLTREQTHRIRPWQRICRPDAIQNLFEAAGLPKPGIVCDDDSQPLSDASEWWTVVLGSGFRGDIVGLSDTDQRILRDNVLRKLEQEAVQAFDTSVLHAVVKKPVPTDQSTEEDQKCNTEPTAE